jgi:8-hydroxy-5-deazaflavin:NADPH oxidoreductase
MAAQRIACAAMPDQVTVIGGSGALGQGLALRLAAAGVPVVIGSRDESRAQEAAARVKEQVAEADVRGLANGPAAEASEIVFLTVPFRNQSETLTNLKNHLREGQLLVDATVPLAAAVSGKATRTLGVWQGSAAQQAQEMVPPGVRVVAALHTVNAPGLKDLSATLDEDVLICGDKKADKRRVAQLIDLIPGLRAVNGGPLEAARTAEMLTALLIGVNARYKTHAGIRLTGLPDELW